MTFLHGLAAFFIFKTAMILTSAKPKLPLGITDFSTLVQSKYTFIDKTEFILDVMTNSSYINAISWPRKFGKTLSLSMLHHFLDTRKGKTDLFAGLKISKDKKFCAEHKNKWPVVFFSFQGMKNATSFKNAEQAFFKTMQTAFKKHSYLLEENILTGYYKQEFTDILNGKASAAEMKAAISKLCHFVHIAKPYSIFAFKKVILLVDDFDAPFRAAYRHGYYDKLKVFMEETNPASWLQHSPFVQKALIMTSNGITPRSTFQNMELTDDYSTLDGRFSSTFGFTPEDAGNLLSKTGSSVSLKELTDWYGGYDTGGLSLYNPWSVLSCLDQKTTGPYWVRTPGSEVVDTEVGLAGVVEIVTIKCYLLKECKHSDGSIEKLMDTSISLGAWDRWSENFWLLLAQAGYLTAQFRKQQYRRCLYSLRIPNKETQNEITSWLDGKFNHGARETFKLYDGFVNNIKAGRVGEIESFIWKSLTEKGNNYRFEFGWDPDKQYRAYLCTLFAVLKDDYELSCGNTEPYEDRRYYLTLVPKDKSRVGMIFQLEIPKNKVEFEALKDLKGKAQEALKRIKDRKAMEELVRVGCKKVVGVGLGISLQGLALEYEDLSGVV